MRGGTTRSDQAPPSIFLPIFLAPPAALASALAERRGKQQSSYPHAQYSRYEVIDYLYAFIPTVATAAAVALQSSGRFLDLRPWSAGSQHIFFSICRENTDVSSAVQLGYNFILLGVITWHHCNANDCIGLEGAPYRAGK